MNSKGQNALALNEGMWRESLVNGIVKNKIAYAQFMLNKVSRTFALNIRILPSKLQFQVLLAYLFCRMADTLEDDTSLDPDAKINLLAKFKALFPAQGNWKERIQSIKQGLPGSWNESEKWDRLLIYHLEWVYGLYVDVPKREHEIIAKWVAEMCSGMAEFTQHQTNPQKKNAIIRTLSELDKYCYYVAGTVGNLLCDLFFKHSRWISPQRRINLQKYSVSFGLGLQLTNILKDVLQDLERNILFIPDSLLQEHQLSAESLLLPENKEKLEEIITVLIQKAQAHLTDALEYTCLLPRLEPRLRLFCLWPLFMAIDTLIVISQSLHSEYRDKEMKISRWQVQNILRHTSVICCSNFFIRRLFLSRMERLNTNLIRK